MTKAEFNSLIAEGETVHLECTVQDVLDKVEEFKAQGCKSFE